MPHRTSRIPARPWATLALALAGGCFGDGGQVAGTDATGTSAGTDVTATTANPGTSGGDPATTGGGVDLCTTPAVGAAIVRRLTRNEYNNAVRDLLGDTTRPADAFPAEEVVWGFNNNAGAQSVGDLLAEQYMAAAEALSAAAVADLAALLPCDPLQVGDEVCGHAFIDAFARRAYRRPLADDERARLHAVFAWGMGDGGLGRGVELSLQAMLQAPAFLYRVESGEPDAGLPPGLRRLTAWELASRLSFLVWASIPDDVLLDRAESGQLEDPDVLRAEAERMLADPRAASPVRDFFAQLVELDLLPGAPKDPATFPEFTDPIRAHMAEETLRFVEHVFFADDARLATVLTAPYTFLNAELANYYDFIGLAGPEFGKVDLPAGSHRAGLLTHGSLLATLGKFESTAPVHRGKFVRQQLLCQVILPPPDVEFQPPDIDPNATTREKYSEHSVNPACAGCHALMDPIGFGFEHFDGAGRWRAVENGFPVDASGEILINDPELAGPFDGLDELAARLAGSAAVRACLVRQQFRYGLGREPAPEDMCTLDALEAAFEASGGDLRALVLALVASDAFRYLAPEEP